MVELIEYSFESNNTVLLVSYNINDKYRRMKVNGIFKDYILENFVHNGISETVYNDFISKTDVKYKVDDEHIISFVEWFHDV